MPSSKFRKNFDPLYRKGNIMKRSLVSALVLSFAVAGCSGRSSVPAAGEAETCLELFKDN